MSQFSWACRIVGLLVWGVVFSAWIELHELDHPQNFSSYSALLL